MPMCCAVGCCNSARKGYKLYRFPKDATRKKMWEHKVSRKDWTALSSSRICQVHFEDIMFEPKRPDKKLKGNAVPTIFSHRPRPKHRKLPTSRNKDDLNDQPRPLFHLDHSYSTTQQASELPETHDEHLQTVVTTMEIENQSSANTLKQLQTRIQELENELRAEKIQKERIVKCYTQQQAHLKKVFTEDQFKLKAVGGKSFRLGLKWSPDNVNKAVQPWKLGKLNHIAIACPDLDKAASLYKDVLHAHVSRKQALPDHGVTVIFVELGDTKIELLHPLGANSPIQKYLEKNVSGGLHHICIEVDNIDRAVAEVQSKKIRTLSDKPSIGAHGKPVIFLHPKDCNGVLIELEQA